MGKLTWDDLILTALDLYLWQIGVREHDKVAISMCKSGRAIRKKNGDILWKSE